MSDVKKKILIIEDNEISMKLFADLLITKGYVVSKSYDGEEGYELLKENKFDLLLLDIQLPKMSGFELLERAEKEGLKLPKTVIVSAFATPDEINRAKFYNIKNYITKPIDVMKFIVMIDTLLEKGE